MEGRRFEAKSEMPLDQKFPRMHSTAIRRIQEEQGATEMARMSLSPANFARATGGLGGPRQAD